MNISSFNPVASSIGTGSKLANTTASEKSRDDAIEQQFLNYAHMSPMDRLRASILKDMGLTENDLASMSPQEQKKVEEVIKQKIKEALDKTQLGKGDKADAADSGGPAKPPAGTPSLSSSVLAQMIALQAGQGPAGGLAASPARGPVANGIG